MYVISKLLTDNTSRLKIEGNKLGFSDKHGNRVVRMKSLFLNYAFLWIDAELNNSQSKKKI